ncbi:MAG: hypothetical protein Q8P72_04575 [Candidatus Roizmanbacteria bacterium]|nr:hypothetical protein [Candidatus Roizmanbacteria bacterium]
MAQVTKISKKNVFLIVSASLFMLGVIFFSLAIQKYQVLTRSRADEPKTCNGTAVGECVGSKRCANNPADDGKFYYWCVKCGIDGNPESSEQGTGECCGNCGGPAPTGEQGQCTNANINSDEKVCTDVCKGTVGSSDRCNATGGVACGDGCAYYDPNNTSCGTCQGTNAAVWDGLCYKGEGTGKVTVHKGTQSDNSCPISAGATEVSLSKDQCYTLSSSCEQADPDGGTGVCVDTGCESGGETTPTVPPDSTPTTPPNTPTSSPTSTPTGTLPPSTPTSSPTRTPTSTPTNTPTNTPTITPTSTPTRTPTPNPTSTPVPTATLVPTSMPIPPTATPVPTNTPVPPTPTTVVLAQVPTSTPTPVTKLTVNDQPPGGTPWALILVPIGLLILGLIL